MGAWGHDIFDDDTACDVLYGALDQSIESFAAEAIQAAKKANLDYWDCHTILVAGALADAVINGTDYDAPADDYASWLPRQNKDALAPLKSELVKAMTVVLSDKSELREAWSLHEDDLSEWKSNVEKVIANLGG